MGRIGKKFSRCVLNFYVYKQSSKCLGSEQSFQDFLCWEQLYMIEYLLLEQRLRVIEILEDGDTVFL